MTEIRRSNFAEHALLYGSVGASRDETLMKYPPEGMVPSEDAIKLGSGIERFRIATDTLMTWGAQTGAGLSINTISAGTGDKYLGIEYDLKGLPVAGAHRDEELFSSEGVPFITPGITAMLGEGEEAREIRVIFVVNEPRRIGFAYGTLDDNGPVGEEYYSVEHRDDDTVWAVYRGFHNGEGSIWRKAFTLLALRAAQDRARQQLRALLPTAVTIETEATADLSLPDGAENDTELDTDPQPAADTHATEFEHAEHAAADWANIEDAELEQTAEPFRPAAAATAADPQQPNPNAEPATPTYNPYTTFSI